MGPGWTSSMSAAPLSCHSTPRENGPLPRMAAHGPTSTPIDGRGQGAVAFEERGLAPLNKSGAALRRSPCLHCGNETDGLATCLHLQPSVTLRGCEGKSTHRSISLSHNGKFCSAVFNHARGRGGGASFHWGVISGACC